METKIKYCDALMIREDFQFYNHSKIELTLNKLNEKNINNLLLYISLSTFTFKIKKIWYKLKKNLAFAKRHRNKYKDKYKRIKTLIKEAKKFKKQILK